MATVKMIFPSGRIGTLRGGFRRHGDARKHMLSREVEMRARFGIKLYISTVED